MRCKAGRRRGSDDGDFELSRFYHLERRAGGAAAGDGEVEEEEECRMEKAQPVLESTCFPRLSDFGVTREPRRNTNTRGVVVKMTTVVGAERVPLAIYAQPREHDTTVTPPSLPTHTDTHTLSLGVSVLGGFAGPDL